MNLLSVTLVAVVASFACKPRQEGRSSAVLAEGDPAPAEPGPSAPRASGKLGEDLEWELHHGIPFCESAGQGGGITCTMADIQKARSQSTARSAVRQVLADRRFKHIYISTPAISDKEMIAALCDRAPDDATEVFVMFSDINRIFMEQVERSCPKARILALPMIPNQAATAVTTILATSDTDIVVVHGDGPLSNAAFSFNINLWQIFRTKPGNRLAKMASCQFSFLAARTQPDISYDRVVSEFDSCVSRIEAPDIPGLVWRLPRPTSPERVNAMKVMGDSERALQAFTNRRYDLTGVRLEMVMDDDFGLTGRCAVGRMVEAPPATAKAEKELRGKGAVARYVETNGSIGQRLKARFWIQDDKAVHTSVVLSASITDPAIVQSYGDFWNRVAESAISGEKFAGCQSGN